MSSKVLKSNFFNEGSIEITGASNRYDLRWDPENGNVELIQRGVVLDGKPMLLFKNDKWDDNAIANALTSSGGSFDYVPDGLSTEVGRVAFSREIADQIIAAHKNNGKGVLPEWVKDYQSAKTNEERNVALTQAIETRDTSKIANKTAEEFKPSEQPWVWADFKKTDVTLNTIKELMLDGPLKYPIDAIYSNRKTGYNQDHVRITQYTYKPPRAALVGYKNSKDDKASVSEIATQGAQRLSPLEKYLGMVRLPMPTDISDSNNVAWGQDQINNISAALTAAVGQNMGATAIGAGIGKITESVFGGSGLTGAGALIGALSQSGLKVSNFTKPGAGQFQATAGATVQSRLLAMAGIQVSPEAILARGLGVIPNSNMELLFNAPALREFAFSWKMTPRDEYEAKKGRHIIRFFKQGMAARKMQGTGSSAAGKNSLFLGTPNVFHVQYKTNRDEDIEGVNRIKTCAVTGCSLNYTPDGVWSAYEEGQPVSTVMSLRLQELEPIYDTDYQGDVLSGRKFREIPGSPGSKAGGDLYKISLDEVGY